MIKILTYAFNNPKYLEYQVKAFKKFLAEPFEFICIDNSVNAEVREQLRLTSKELGIRYEINKRPNHAEPGLSHSSALQWSYNEIIERENDITIMLDHDMFPIKPFSINDLLQGKHFAGCPQSRGPVSYLHPCLMALDVPNLPSKHNVVFHGGFVEQQNVDTGGQLYWYFKRFHVKVNHLKAFIINEVNENLVWIPEQFRAEYDSKYAFEIIEEKFIHTRLGSNWILIDADTFKNRDKLIYGVLDSYIL